MIFGKRKNIAKKQTSILTIIGICFSLAQTIWLYFAIKQEQDQG